MVASLRRPARLAVVLLYEGGFVTLFVLSARDATVAGTSFKFEDATLSAAFAALPLVGALIEWHQPGNRIGRLLLAIGVGTVLAVLAGAWAQHTLRAAPGTLPDGRVAAWLAAWMLVPSLGAGPWLFATFPTGHVETRWLRRLAFVAAGGLATLTLAQAFAPESIDGVYPAFAPIRKPLGIPSLQPRSRLRRPLGPFLLSRSRWLRLRISLSATAGPPESCEPSSAGWRWQRPCCR